MSKYTTGEIAKLCKVTVRTVQYYDSRNILIPYEFSEGGRRLYTDEDLKRLRIICFLRDLGFSIEAIKKLLNEEKPELTIHLLLKEQEKVLSDEIKAKQEKLSALSKLQSELRKVDNFTVDSISDIAHIMENKAKMKKLHMQLIGFGLSIEIIELVTLFLGIWKGFWYPFLIAIPVVIAAAIWLSIFYYKSVTYICPQCHTVFKPGFKQMFWASHTPKTRKLTCPDCGYRGYCVETYDEQNNA